jgi:hypothetical protein
VVNAGLERVSMLDIKVDSEVDVEVVSTLVEVNSLMFVGERSVVSAVVVKLEFPVLGSVIVMVEFTKGEGVEVELTSNDVVENEAVVLLLLLFDPEIKNPGPGSGVTASVP